MESTKPRLTRVAVSVSEAPDRWVIEWTAGHIGSHYTETAAEADKYVRGVLAEMADNDVSSVCVVTWIPRTRVGRIVAQVIAKAEGR